MASKPECIDCGTIYDVRRWKLGYNICLDCGKLTPNKSVKTGVSHHAHKQGATLVTRKSDLLGLNKYMGEV